MCAMLACAWAERAAAESPPYEARVIAAGASVHSGPGDNFYPTDSLAQGDVVEVYREKPGGWLAIRPPVNSFSWVAERDLILKDGGLAEVVRDGVASRIGSRLNDRHNASQVRLKKGEAVEVVGEENVNGEKWCKIAPPAGEFRWIQASLVEKTGAIPASSPTAATAVTQAKPTASAVPTTDNSGAPPLLASTKPSDTTATPLANAKPPTANVAPPEHSAGGQQPATAATGDLAHDLAAIELRLSRMAAAPTNLWNTERLEHDTAQLMARAKRQPNATP